MAHLAKEEFKRRPSVDIMHIPHKCRTPSPSEVVAGTVAMLETVADMQSFVQAGKLLAMAAGTNQRLSEAVGVSTLAAGHGRDFNAVTWSCFPAS